MRDPGGAMRVKRILASLFGLAIASGAVGEILSVTWPGFMPPEAAEIPFMAKHLSAIGLRAWVALSNVVNFACGVVFVRVACQPRGTWRAVELAASILAIVVLLSMFVSACYFFPMPAEARARRASEILGACMIAASAGMLFAAWIWRSVARGQRRVVA